MHLKAHCKCCLCLVEKPRGFTDAVVVFVHSYQLATKLSIVPITQTRANYFLPPSKVGENQETEEKPEPSIKCHNVSETKKKTPRR